MNKTQQEVCAIVNDILTQYFQNPEVDLAKLLADALSKMTKAELNFFNDALGGSINGVFRDSILERLGWEKADESELKQINHHPILKSASEEMIPPWLKHPGIPCFSIGWRMGWGEAYMLDWQGWIHDQSIAQRIEYFKHYLPIPMEWLVWVGDFCGHRCDYLGTGEAIFNTVAALEKDGLANLKQFEQWAIERKKAQEATK